MDEEAGVLTIHTPTVERGARIMSPLIETHSRTDDIFCSDCEGARAPMGEDLGDFIVHHRHHVGSRRAYCQSEAVLISPEEGCKHAIFPSAMTSRGYPEMAMYVDIEQLLLDASY